MVARSNQLGATQSLESLHLTLKQVTHTLPPPLLNSGYYKKTINEQKGCDQKQF